MQVGRHSPQPTFGELRAWGALANATTELAADGRWTRTGHHFHQAQAGADAGRALGWAPCRAGGRAPAAGGLRRGSGRAVSDELVGTSTASGEVC